MKPHSSSRRSFLQGTAAAGTAALTANLGALANVHAAASELIRVAVIGAGGRGTGAAIDCANAGGNNVKIVAIADAFADRAKRAATSINRECKDKADIGDRIFVGLDAYEKALNCGVEMVILAGPPGFRPQHYEAAVKAGKHVFMEKPLCVCAGGFRKVMAANRLADEKNLKVVVGLQRHHQGSYLGAIDAIRAGKVGDITLLRAYWNGQGIWNRERKEGMTEMQYQVNNWYHFVWLSGDNICEQHVHNLDIGNWIMAAVLNKEGADWAHPIEANGMGASLTRGYNGKNVQGQIFDAYFVEFTFDNGTRMYSQCRHQPGTWGIVNEFFHSTLQPKGRAVAGTGTNPKLQHANPYVQEHYALQQAIKDDKKLHEGWHGAISSMTAVLGREAVYSGRIVRWDDLVKNGPDTFPTKLAWDANPPVMPDQNGMYPIPVPGQYKAF